MRFRDLFESSGYEYWASMPHEHLHAETNRIMADHNLNRVASHKWAGRVGSHVYVPLVDHLKGIGWHYVNDGKFRHHNGSYLYDDVSSWSMIPPPNREQNG